MYAALLLEVAITVRIRGSRLTGEVESEELVLLQLKSLSKLEASARPRMACLSPRLKPWQERRMIVHSMSDRLVHPPRLRMMRAGSFVLF